MSTNGIIVNPKCPYQVSKELLYSFSRYEKAQGSTDYPNYQLAMESEMNSICENRT